MPYSPEGVVTAQLKAFQQLDLSTAFHCGSLSNQEITGPSWREFSELISTRSTFKPLLQHRQAHILMTVSHDDWGICCLVRVISKNKQCREYWWELTKETPNAQWMVDSILPTFQDFHDLDVDYIITDDHDDDDDDDHDDHHDMYFDIDFF
eukprot:CAMPEP_0202469150 /NCGR_PEP_ID=MMETSP1360-20130828/77621_1 /ASSEMBLY_ACC=CAM_ASM_000848 /TAXON_ID=515479 /ORGANISM="Licmophora paradoxa, Strain CCMP2313" /LENGTH=150 /DNA_ID=CAMNT_0049094387 /DNA_START=75 /DNA_END=527 /DNA_ORIENTATION=-